MTRTQEVMEAVVSKLKTLTKELNETIRCLRNFRRSDRNSRTTEDIRDSSSLK